jgi:hypothetical protein
MNIRRYWEKQRAIRKAKDKALLNDNIYDEVQ